MMNPYFLTFVGGVAVGFLGAMLLRLLWKPKDIEPGPTISTVDCLSSGDIQINGTTGSPLAGTTLVAIHVKVYDDHNTQPPDSPENEGATPYRPPQFPITHTPSGLTGPPDLVVVWGEYQGHLKDQFTITCLGSGSSRIGQGRAVSPAVAEQLEAIPRSYRVSPKPPAGGTGVSSVELVGVLAGISEAILHYVPEASTPTEPFWQARNESGPIREWALRLLHRHGGFLAVLSVVGFVGNREVRLTWVSSDWRFHADNRLTAESDEAAGFALMVRPA